MSIFSFLNSKKYSPKILELDAKSDVKSDFVGSIFSKELDLILVRNAIPSSIINSVVNELSSIPNELTFPTPFGCIYGRTLIGSNNEIDNYSEIGYKLNKYLSDKTGYDLNEISIESLFRLTNYSRKIKLANVNGIDYSGYTIKILEPNKGGLHVHIGSEFLKLLPECKKLSENIQSKHQISFFYVLQAPQKGGELTLFDLDWESSPSDLVGEKSFYSHEERENYFRSRKKHSIIPKPGDLIVFNGGNVWHKVEDIIGDRNRITFGGFLGQEVNSSDILFWN